MPDSTAESSRCAYMYVGVTNQVATTRDSRARGLSKAAGVRQVYVFDVG